MADPVADFMAREQEMLAELDDAPTVPSVPSEPSPPVMVDPTVDSLVDDFTALSAPADPDVSSFGGSSIANNDDFSAFESNAPAVNGGNGLSNGHGSGSSKGASPVPSMPRIEAENIRKWREEQAVLLEKKDDEEERKRNDLRAAAKRDLDEWYAQREAALKVAKEANQKSEAEHVAAFAKSQGDGAQWDEVAKLCNDSKNVKGGKDVSRLKSLLLHLKDHAAK